MAGELPTEAACPSCGSNPTYDSVVRHRLSDLGYEHDDVRLQCANCDDRWTCGIPLGDPDDDTWVCDCCGGDLQPHFVYIDVDDERVRIKPKCRDCYWVPDDPIVADASSNGTTVRWFVGHHSVTGSTESAEPNDF